jgi:hypothetical protein
MKKAYVILRKGFEYDDSVYTSQEGGHPNLIVFSKKEAYDKIRDLNIKEFKENTISDYSYELDEILNVTIDEYRTFNDKLMANLHKDIHGSLLMISFILKQMKMK